MPRSLLARVQEAVGRAREVTDHPVLTQVARVGLVAYGAMRTILDAPFGRFLLTLVALGIAAFGAYLLVRARYPERT